MQRKAKTPPSALPPLRKPPRIGSSPQRQAQRFLRSMPARHAPLRHQGR